MKADQYRLFALEEDVRMGLGYWTRANSEVCLLATRGKPKRQSASVRQGIIEPLREHSRKPDCTHDRIQILSARIALERGDYPTVEQLMQHEYAVVREGETELTDIWFELHYRRNTAAGTTLSDAAKAELRRLNPPPVHIDFRAITK
jgi:hypothetical protein